MKLGSCRNGVKIQIKNMPDLYRNLRVLHATDCSVYLEGEERDEDFIDGKRVYTWKKIHPNRAWPHNLEVIVI